MLVPFPGSLAGMMRPTRLSPGYQVEERKRRLQNQIFKIQKTNSSLPKDSGSPHSSIRYVSVKLRKEHFYINNRVRNFMSLIKHLIHSEIKISNEEKQ